MLRGTAQYEYESVWAAGLRSSHRDRCICWSRWDHRRSRQPERLTPQDTAISLYSSASPRPFDLDGLRVARFVRDREYVAPGSGRCVLAICDLEGMTNSPRVKESGSSRSSSRALCLGSAATEAALTTMTLACAMLVEDFRWCWHGRRGSLARQKAGKNQ
jgi:hypothetical protein